MTDSSPAAQPNANQIFMVTNHQDFSSWAADSGYRIHEWPLPPPAALPHNLRFMPPVVQQMAGHEHSTRPTRTRAVCAEGGKLLFWKWPPGPTIPNGDELIVPLSRANGVVFDPYWLRRYPFVDGVSADGKLYRFNLSRFAPNYFHVKGDYAFVGGRTNFGHWLGDFLPNFRFTEHIEAPAPRVVTTKLQPWQRDMLPYFPAQGGVAELDPQALCSVFEFERLWFAEQLPFSDRIGYIRDRFLRDRPPEGGAGPRRIYLSRAAQGNRARVANDDEITEYLTTKDFSIIHSERLSTRENIEAINGADIVITAPGSGYFNYFAFSKRRSVLINLWPRNLFYGCPENFQRGALYYNYPFLDQTIFTLGTLTRPADSDIFPLNIPAMYSIEKIKAAIDAAEDYLVRDRSHTLLVVE